ncbi:extracellular solute-binding protein [Micromonospora peucetia]|uniref:Alpha-glucoside transport system substrate-binding protein n=1 Tax=Micromonospora peucetia TaxID=47871 RepID=A0A1C6W1G3_9ACTN|nr:extracellular solute-binding protein [Micromonospora peucetia]MCX4390978.1 extracellular solute-binding protein [Micromonospora peucetia]WSA31907.1 extracellular solute-binding protein [Micromonospora peucetia]SCL72356.1 alpha-glucoside transport system substrate-binding protein [Micromonospora peucetia]
MTTAARPSRRTLLRATAAATVTAAAGCSGAPPAVQVAVVWSGGELARFREVVAGYDAGVQVISAGNDIDAFLRARQLAGTSPDVAILPRSGLVVEYARRGWLRELTPAASYALPPGLADLLSADGRRYGVWVKAAHKSLFWYFPSMLHTPPRTWDQLVTLTRRLGARARAGDGPAPLAVGAADGWVLTDWFENVLADVAPAGYYEALARGEADWRSPSTHTALDRLAELWSIDGAFPGGGRRALLTQYEESVIQVVYHQRATMLFEADFVDDVSGRFRRGSEQLKTFRFPGSRVADHPLIIGGDAAVAFAGSTRGAELVRWLSDGSTFQPWLSAGGYLSPNVSVPLDDYRDPVRRRLAAELRTPGAVHFDLSDGLPGPFTGSDGVGIWRIMQDFFADVTNGVAAGEATRRAVGQLAAAARSTGGGR